MHVAVLLQDDVAGSPLVTASAFASDNRLIAFEQAPSSSRAIDILELRLIAILQRPFTLHIILAMTEPVSSTAQRRHVEQR